MKVSRTWLQRYFKDELPGAEELGELLTFKAFEIDGIEQHGDDAVIDVKVTPNRGHDCLCHRGIAKELSVLLNRALVSDPLRQEVPPWPVSKLVQVSVDDTSRCPRYSALVIEGVSVGPSPAWLKESLEALGQRSINNVVDATNYVMLNVGQPLHAFDADKLMSGGDRSHIKVRCAVDGEHITTLDNRDCELSAEDLIITDGVSGQGIGIAGIKGGKVAEVGAGTVNLVIESANFDRASVRKTSQRLKLRTDASMRFENEISAGLTTHALREVGALIVDIAGGKVEGWVDVDASGAALAPVAVSVGEINELLGTHIKEDEVVDIFDRFGFDYSHDAALVTVQPPFERLDLTIKEDLIEEVGRVYGLEKIVPVVPDRQALPRVSKRYVYEDMIRRALIERGWSEVLTSSFRSDGDVELANALASDKNFLRRNLADNLSESLVLNAGNAPLLGLESVRIFEIGSVFSGKERERLSLCLAAWHPGKKGTARSKEVLEEVVAALSKALGVKLEGVRTDATFETDLGAVIAGLPDVDSFDISKGLPEVTYRPFSRFPFALRDIALWVPSSTSTDEVRGVIESAAGALLIRADLFDTFENGERTSYAYHLVFQSHERTLTDDELMTIMEAVTKAVESRGWEVR